MVGAVVRRPLLTHQNLSSYDLELQPDRRY